jgi:ABC-type lipoprotein release transport system permease subunit
VLALLFVHVFAERKQIAIVRALGLGVMEIFIVYFLKSLWIAVPGIALGAGLGIGVCAYFQRSPIFQSDGFVVHPSLHVVSIVVPCLVVLATVLLAGVAPAVVAGRTDPIRHLKGE